MGRVLWCKIIYKMEPFLKPETMELTLNQVFLSWLLLHTRCADSANEGIKWVLEQHLAICLCTYALFC